MRLRARGRRWLGSNDDVLEDVVEQIVNQSLLLAGQCERVLRGGRAILIEDGIDRSRACECCEEEDEARKNEEGDNVRLVPIEEFPELQLNPEPGRHMPQRNRGALVLQLVSPRSLVGPLFLGSGPSAIGRFVVPVHINAVDAMARRWASPHVSQECLIRSAPFVTDANPPSPVGIIVLVLGVIATGLHRVPRAVFRRIASVFAVSTQRAGMTAATSNVGPVAQGTSSHYAFITADAPTAPQDHRAFAGRADFTASLFNRSESPEALTCNVNSWGHLTSESFYHKTKVLL